MPWEGLQQGLGKTKFAFAKDLPFPEDWGSVRRASIFTVSQGASKGPGKSRPATGQVQQDWAQPSPHPPCTQHARAHTLGFDGEMLPPGHQCPQLCPDLGGGWAEGAGAVLRVGGGGAGDKGGTEPVLWELQLRSAPAQPPGTDGHQ